MTLTHASPVPFILGVAIILLFIAVRKCSDDNVPDVVYKARAVSLISMDTTKPTPKVKYKLMGSDTLFSILSRQIYSPGDVTPNDLRKLMEWFGKSIQVDSTTNK